MLLLNKPEEALCHSFCCVLAQGHVMGRCLVAVIVLFQLFLLSCGALCGFACSLASVTWQCGFVTGNHFFYYPCNLCDAIFILLPDPAGDR
jgi:hypothetical protein